MRSQEGMFIYMHCVCMHVYMYVFLCLHEVDSPGSVCIHTYIHTYIHAFIHMCLSSMSTSICIT